MFFCLHLLRVYIAAGGQDHPPLSSHHRRWWLERGGHPGRQAVPKCLPREIPGHHHDHMFQLISDKLAYSTGWTAGREAAQLSFQHSRPLCNPHVTKTTLIRLPISSFHLSTTPPEKLEQSIRCQLRTVTSHLQMLILLPEKSQPGQPRRTQDTISFTQRGAFTATATLCCVVSLQPGIAPPRISLTMLPLRFIN